ncbi:unnamed protein product [Pedinophyceae sp. YPF-701]|nr:unnamed protein product [Pedinophyceae sp. YPF-701]
MTAFDDATERASLPREGHSGEGPKPLPAKGTSIIQLALDAPNGSEMQRALSLFDRNKDGHVDATELVEAYHAYKNMRTERTFWRRVIAGSVVFFFLLLACMTGLVVAVVLLSKEVEVGDDGVLLSSSGSTPVRTAASLGSVTFAATKEGRRRSRRGLQQDATSVGRMMATATCKQAEEWFTQLARENTGGLVKMEWKSTTHVFDCRAGVFSAPQGWIDAMCAVEGESDAVAPYRLDCGSAISSMDVDSDDCTCPIHLREGTPEVAATQGGRRKLLDAPGGAETLTAARAQVARLLELGADGDDELAYVGSMDRHHVETMMSGGGRRHMVRVDTERLSSVPVAARFSRSVATADGWQVVAWDARAASGAVACPPASATCVVLAQSSRLVRKMLGLGGGDRARREAQLAPDVLSGARQSEAVRIDNEEYERSLLKELLAEGRAPGRERSLQLAPGVSPCRAFTSESRCHAEVVSGQRVCKWFHGSLCASRACEDAGRDTTKCAAISSYRTKCPINNEYCAIGPTVFDGYKCVGYLDSCPAPPSSSEGCLTGGARLLGPSGRWTPVEDARIGDMVAVQGPGGTVLFSRIAWFGQMGPNRKALSVEVTTRAGARVTVTASHYLIARSAGGAARRVRADAVRVGWEVPVLRDGLPGAADDDDVAGQVPSGTVWDVVDTVRVEEKLGVWSIHTASGLPLIVDGVAASEHADNGMEPVVKILHKPFSVLTWLFPDTAQRVNTWLVRMAHGRPGSIGTVVGGVDAQRVLWWVVDALKTASTLVGGGGARAELSAAA